MNNAPKTSTKPKSSGHLVRNLLELGELQIMLLRADAAAAGKSTRVAALLVAVAICLLLAAAPVLLLSAAAWLESSQELSRSASLALTGGGAVVLAAVLLVAARSSINRGLSMLSQTVDELVQNIECLKRGLADPHDEATPQGPGDHD
ncbi:phage holin family protein [Aeoliella sp. ICT_H6.2]|uniref:Phage holin family protein n=1 Tax=Aeoliella straminimaris TaxID=2954799 RepID=A0A9X2JJ14_9BACT|nr:phage holin family protein [Aeoliella straminimaris]MCO6046288.1 phage holin family protein [Aeoliella straminimaris]